MGPEAASPHHPSSRDVSATDLVRLASHFDADEMSRALKQADNSPDSRSSSIAEWQDRMQVSSFEAAKYREAANAAGQAAGALNAQVSVPECQSSASGAQRAADASGRASDVGSAADNDRAGSARSTSSERTSTWLSRVTAKSDDLRSMFGLPATEVSSFSEVIQCLTFLHMSHLAGCGAASISELSLSRDSAEAAASTRVSGSLSAEAVRRSLSVRVVCLTAPAIFAAHSCKF